MRALFQRPFVFAAIINAAVLGRVHAQPADEPEQITVIGGKSPSDYRVAMERARDEIFRVFNEANKSNDTDIRCRNESPTGSRMRQSVCRSEAENRADAAAARGFLNSLLLTSGRAGAGAGGGQRNADVGTGAAQAAAVSGGADALAKFEAEWAMLYGENPELREAVARYAALVDEYARARGVEPSGTLEAPPAMGANLLQCATTTVTEYVQRNDVARVEARVSASNCPAGTAGQFTLVARVRNDSGEITPIEFQETWRDDSPSVTFKADYPIGENVELMSVRVRDVECTCTEPAANP